MRLGLLVDFWLEQGKQGRREGSRQQGSKRNKVKGLAGCLEARAAEVGMKEKTNVGMEKRPSRALNQDFRLYPFSQDIGGRALPCEIDE